MNKITLSVSFDIIEDVIKQEELFEITDEEKQKALNKKLKKCLLLTIYNG